MGLMIVGLAAFLGVHSLPIFGRVRSGIIGAVGAVPYKIGFSILSLVGLIILSQGYQAWTFAGSPLLYDPPTWLAHLSLLLMLVAFVSFAATYSKGYIKKTLKHPMIAAVKIWAFAHLLAVGHAAAVTLFAAFLAWGVVERISVKRREKAGEAVVGNFEPRLSHDIIVVAIGVAVYVLFVWQLHLWLIGVSPVG